MARIVADRRCVHLFKGRAVPEQIDLIIDSSYLPRTYADDLPLVVWRKSYGACFPCGSVVSNGVGKEMSQILRRNVQRWGDVKIEVLADVGEEVKKEVASIGV